MVDIPLALSGLNYQAGEWLGFFSHNPLNGMVSGVCTNDVNAYNWFNDLSGGASYGIYLNGDTLYNAHWYTPRRILLRFVNYPDVYQMLSYESRYPYLYSYMLDRGASMDGAQEIFISNSGFRLGNRVVLTVARNRLEACGY